MLEPQFSICAVYKLNLPATYLANECLDADRENGTNGSRPEGMDFDAFVLPMRKLSLGETREAPQSLLVSKWKQPRPASALTYSNFWALSTGPLAVLQNGPGGKKTYEL